MKNIFRKISGDFRIVPAVMFHSIGLENSDWIFRNISEPVKFFEEKISYLHKAGFNFIFWKELYDYMTGSRPLKLPAIMITFDDGYLDNWVYAYPILKKYNAKATIFANPDFVDPCPKVRRNLEDVWNMKCRETDLVTAGFLNWNEMRAMERAGTIDIQSHALTHTWYFSSNKLIDFYKPSDKHYPWMAWNLHPEHKPFYLTDDQSNIVPWGTPIYEFEKSLVCKKYYPPPEVEKEIVAYVENRGGSKFFQNTKFYNVLKELHDRLMKCHRGGQHFEDDDEYQSRVLNELQKSKKILEEALTKTVDFLCWPGGGYNNRLVDLSMQVGYKSSTFGSQDNSSFRNIYRADPKQIKRMGSSPISYFKGRKLGYTTGYEFLLAVKSHQNSLHHNFLGKLLRLSKFIF